MSRKPHNYHRNCTRVTLSVKFDYADGSSVTVSQPEPSGCWPGGYLHPDRVVTITGKKFLERAAEFVRSWV